jgi:hypothetical protein
MQVLPDATITATTFANDCKGTRKGIDDAGEGEPSKRQVCANDAADSPGELDDGDDDVNGSTEGARHSMIHVED